MNTICEVEETGVGILYLTLNKYMIMIDNKYQKYRMQSI